MTAPTVLLTGATGFVGGATAVELLLRHPSCRVVFLVRGDAPEHRVRQSLARFADLDEIEPALARWSVLHGDLTDPEAPNDPRLGRLTHVLHLAANTSFRSKRAVRHTNVLGALALAHRMRRVAGLSRFVYVGTAYVCGAGAPPVVREDDYPRPDARHLVEYTASKAEAEMLLERTAPELPLVIARPSVVVGHTRLGCLPSASIFWYYRALHLLHRLPTPPTTRKDVIPVNYAARALVWLLLAPALRHKRYHVSAGAAASVSWEEMDAELARCYGPPGEPYRVVDFPSLARE